MPLAFPSTVKTTLSIPSSNRLYTRYQMVCKNRDTQRLPSTAPVLMTCYPEGNWDYEQAFQAASFPGCGGRNSFYVIWNSFSTRVLGW